MPQVDPRLAAAMGSTLAQPVQGVQPQAVPVPVPVAMAPQQAMPQQQMMQRPMPQRPTTGVNAGELGVPWNFRFGQRN